MTQHAYNTPLNLESQLQGGFTVTSPLLPELLTEGDTIEEALANVKDAFVAVLEIYAEEERSLAGGLMQEVEPDRPILTDHLLALA
jgi:antitoxin HicB